MEPHKNHNVHHPRGLLAKYAHTVTSASPGAVMEADLKL